MIKILLVDQDREVHNTLRRLVPDTCSLQSYFRGTLAGDFVQQHRPDAVIVSVDVPDVSPASLVREITAVRRAPPVAVLAHRAETEGVAAALQAGAREYLLRPFSRRDVDVTLARLLNGRAPAEDSLGDAAERLIRGHSPAIRELRRFIRRVARADAPVLLLGESGSGKEIAARVIHELSGRRSEPFVAANCGAIPEPIFESEMFGAAEGAYTDAVARPGYLEQAGKGTMFMDEIGEMSLLNQTKILRVIEERRIRRVGGTRERLLPFRLIAASNRDLRGEVRQRRFRQDLYFRLSVLTCHLPRLRDRLEDLPELAEGFLVEAGEAEVKISDGAYERLCSHPWPGNIRELRNVIQRAAVLREGREISAEDISFV